MDKDQLTQSALLVVDMLDNDLAIVQGLEKDSGNDCFKQAAQCLNASIGWVKRYLREANSEMP